MQQVCWKYQIPPSFKKWKLNLYFESFWTLKATFPELSCHCSLYKLYLLYLLKSKSNSHICFGKYVKCEIGKYLQTHEIFRMAFLFKASCDLHIWLEIFRIHQCLYWMSENGKPQILLISFKPQNIFPLSFFYSKSFCTYWYSIALFDWYELQQIEKVSPVSQDRLAASWQDLLCLFGKTASKQNFICSIKIYISSVLSHPQK